MKLLTLILFWGFSITTLYAQNDEQSIVWIQKGVKAYEQGKYQEAILFLERFDQLYNKNNKFSVPQDREYGDILYLLAESNDQIGYYGKAVEYGKRVVNIYKTTIGENHADYATSLQNLANYYFDNEDYTNAIEYGIKAMTKRKAILGEKHPDYGQSLYNLSGFYSNSGDFTKAIEYGTKALEVCKTTIDESAPLYTELLENLANCFNELGDYSKAVELKGKASAIQKKEYGENSIQYIISLQKVADYYNSPIGDQAKAIECEMNILNKIRAEFGEENYLYSVSLNHLASYYNKLGDYAKAIKNGLYSATITKKLNGEDDPDYATILKNIALYYFNNKKLDKAVEYGTKALEIRKTTLGENNLDYAASLEDLASYYTELGNHEKALELIKRSTRIYKEVQGENSFDFAISLNDLSLCYCRLGIFDKAVEYGEKVSYLYKTILGEENSDYAITLGNLADYYSYLGDYPKAIEYGEKATKIRRNTLGENNQDYAMSLMNLALYYHLIGDNKTAVEYGEKSAHLCKDLYGVHSSDYSGALSNLSIYYNTLGDYKKAMECGEKAVDICKNTLNNNFAYAQALSNYANYCSNNGDYKRAIECVTQSLAILESSSPYYSILLYNLASYYSHLNNYEGAKEYGIKALNYSEKVLGYNHLNNASILNNLAAYYSATSDYSKSIDCVRNSTSIIQSNTLAFFDNLSSNLRTSHWDQYSYVFTDYYPSFYYQSPGKSVSDLYNKSALFAKGLLLSTTTEMNKLILESGDNEALHMYEELRFKRMELQKMYEKPITDRFVNTDSLKTMADQLEKKLIERSKVYGDYTKKLQTTWKDVQQSLADDELALEFLSFNVYGTDSTMVVALTLRKDDKEPKFFPLFELRQLKELSDTVTFLCPDLTSLVWQPLHDELKGIKTIYFSPVGVLHKIGIEYAPGMESYEMFRLSSTREIIDKKAPLKISEELIAKLYGGIDYESSSPTESAENETVSDASLKYSMSQHRAMIDSLDLRGIQIDYLPGTLREVQNIQEALTNKHYNATAYTGTKATETSVKSLSGKDIGILHISTHGFYYTESQAKKKEKLRFLSLDDKHHTNYEDNTLTRSGLFMAGAKLTIDGKDVPMDSDDGILTAQEISMLDLRGTDLVVLSACETGKGDIMQGEGVFGLQRGFKKAGVKSILMSLWKVSDVSTEILMTEFYKNLCDGKSKRESLRFAQKTVREYKDDEGNLLFQDPHYWAGFILLD